MFESESTAHLGDITDRFVYVPTYYIDCHNSVFDVLGPGAPKNSLDPIPPPT
jgi:hypothetical protein